jgi:ribosomal protein S18 acetylase RimI-like enzyme
MTEDDIPRLVEIRPGFVSDTVLDVETSGSGIEVSWRLVERKLLVPFDKGADYDFDATERANVRERLLRGDGLHLVAERGRRLMGILDMLPQEWNSTAFIWNLMLDQEVRGKGLGRDLFERGANWARRMGYRALVLETQTNNVPACRFYARMGCRLDGVRSTYYTNTDVERGEVAIFWTYPLE